MTATAIVTLKVCPECGARAPLGWDIEHEESCSGSPQLCETVRGAWPLEPGDEVVVVPIRGGHHAEAE